MEQKKKEDTREIMDQIEMVKWLLVRSDKFRFSYGNRAMLVMTADAMLVTSSIVFFQNYSNISNCLAVSGLVLVLILVVPSVLYAFFAVCTLKQSSRIATGCKGPDRFFLSPKDSAPILRPFDKFESTFFSLNRASTLDGLLSELQMALILQGRRYNYLKKSVLFFLISFMIFVSFAIILLLRIMVTS